MALASTLDVKEFIEPLSSSACSIHKSVPERIGKEIDFVLQPLRCPNAVLFNDRVHLVSALDELVEPSRAIIQHIDELDTFTVEQLEGEAVSVGLVLHRGKSISYVSQDIMRGRALPSASVSAIPISCSALFAAPVPCRASATRRPKRCIAMSKVPVD